ncbi:MAG TPA: polymorphic toxin type 33 domain-containing protein [Thermoanaerobaculia bacterium]|jgi:RHS repeat-associated protein|nr:polymorphic toxin type 33 domain-containing protein [Thermoanaerobaculia bacterium]
MNALRRISGWPTALFLFALGSLVAALAGSPLSAQEHPNVARGFSRDKAFQIGDVDHVNLFNGNLVLTVPLGQSYPVGGGLSFGLTLTYNSNVWDFEERFAPSQNSYTQALPGLRFNAGLGWLLTLGQLNPPATSTNQSEHEVYLGPDGAEHAFYSNLHEGEAVTKAVQYTRDGSYLRLRGSSGSPREVDFPDGTIHRFDSSNRLIQIRSRFLTPAGQPADTVEITYPSSDFWTIKTTVDGFTRTQTVHFRSGLGSYSKLVDYVELATWNNPSPPSRYTFNYSLVTIQRPCPHNDQTEGGLPLAAAVPLLVSLTRPDGSQVSMPASDYFTDLGAATCASPWNGAIRGLTLPTFGRLEWDYQTYAFPIDSSARPFRQRSAGVFHRRLLTTPTDPNPYLWSYSTAITPWALGSAAEELVNTVTDPLSNRTENYFAIYAKTRVQPTYGTSLFEYGLPISHLTQDGSGRLLSTKTFNGAGQLIRSTYAKYDFDPFSGVPQLEERSRLNQRTTQSETVYHDDPGGCSAPPGTSNPCRISTVVSSDFDGLGHYRTATTGGNFGNADLRTAFTSYNPGRGTYPGSFVPPATATEPWVLETFDRMTESEGGFTSRVDACFDPATGFLKRKRVFKTGTSPSTEDVVAVMTPDVQGNVAVEETYGGDLANLDTAAPLCTMNPGTSRYRATYTYQYGVRATAQATNAAGGIPAAINFKSLDLNVDPSTGLPSESRDSVGWRTTYKYDVLGRVTEIKPLAGPVAGPVGAWTRYTYNRATSGANPATVDAQGCASTSSTCTTPLEQSQLVFDYLGRLTKERRKTPDGTWSKQVTTYNGNGWKDFVSETQADSTNDGSLTGTKYRNYDPFGRPGLLIPADGSAHQVTLAYEGVRKTQRTAKVATSFNTASGTANETFATTTEISDRQGRLAQVIEPNNVSTIYNYDVGQRLRRVCQNSNATGSNCGQERQFSYDNRGFLTFERHPEKGGMSGNGLVTYSNYDPRGHAGHKQDGPADLLFTYDLAERLTDVIENATGRPLKKFTFGTSTSDKGRLAKAERWNYRFLGGSPTQKTALITETYQYLGRDGKPSQRDTTLTYETALNEHFVQTFGYHELGMLEAQSYPNCTGFAACTSGGRTVSNVFTQGRLTAVSGYTGTVPGQGAGVGITYHPNGQINQVAHANSVVATYGLDPNNLPRPASINAAMGGTTLWDTGPYKYDGSGNIWKIGTSWFEYDSLSRLTTGAVFPNPLGGGTQQKQSSAFDVFGNLQSLTTQIGTATATTRLTTTSSATNRLASPSTYDTAGALTNWNGAFYEYDGLNQLAHYVSGTEDWSYIYTADDERIWSFKPAQGATPRSDRWTLRGLDGQVLREYPISGYVWNNWEDNIYRDGQLLANYLSGSQRRHFDLDHLGTPRLITNVGGAVTSYHVYYPFGEEATLATQDTERLKFTGHERDLNNQTGGTPSADDLDYMHARFCSPVTGRFLSVDTVPGKIGSPQSWNRYAYVGGNPLRAVDPDGQDLLDVVNGFVNALGSDLLWGAGRQTPTNSDYAIGQKGGDLAALAGSLIEIQAGAGTVGGAGVVTVVTLGTTLEVTLPVAVVGAAAAVHGSGVFVVASSMLGKDGASSSGTETGDKRNPAQDRRLSKGEIKKLSDSGYDAEELKGGKRTGPRDLFIDSKGNVYVKPKNGSGPGEPTGLNLNNLKRRPRPK